MHYNISSIEPQHDYVLITKVESDQQTPSGILLVHEDKDRSNLAAVIAVGPGREGVPGTKPVTKPGDLVLVDKWIGTKISLNGVEHILVKWYDICAIVKRAA